MGYNLQPYLAKSFGQIWLPICLQIPTNCHHFCVKNKTCIKTMAKNVQQMIQWTMDDLVGFSHQMKFDVASYSSRILKFHLPYSSTRRWWHKQ